MPFSHHSHSGQFCPGHAKNSLEEVIQTAIAQKMEVLCLTEHMPRGKEDFYPEEKLDESVTEEWHVENEAAFYAEASRLRQKYASQIRVLIGFETDWIRPESLQLIETSLSRLPFELIVGSVHHVHTIPIDYDSDMYQEARRIAGGSDEKLFEDYFDSQYDMLQRLQPPVVGHFDLIRLKSDDPNGSFAAYPGVWERIERNLRFVAGYGGILELNSAALRKGMTEPYPKAEICRKFLSMGGRFCMSDDSHGIEQVGFGYLEMFNFVDRAGIKVIHHLDISQDDSSLDARFPTTVIHSVTVDEIKRSPFYQGLLN